MLFQNRHAVPLLMTFILLSNLQFNEAVSVADLLPFGTSNGDTLVPTGDDGSSGLIPIGVPIWFYGTQYNSLYVNINGGVSFREELRSFTTTDFPMPAAIPVIVAFWTDIDTRNGGNIWYRETRDTNILERVSRESQGRVRADWVFVATWDDVAFYDASTVGSQQRNTFQVIIAFDSTSSTSFAIMNYAKIEWTTGNNDGDRDTGLGGTEAMAGFDAGDTTNFFSIPGSRTPAVLDLVNRSNVEIPGKWVFNIGNSTIQAVDSFWSSWGGWNSCSKTCGGGSRSRSRSCILPLNGGRACSGSVTSTSDCNTDNCPVDGGWADYSEWGPCSVSCGGGHQTKTRTCTDPSPQYGGAPCEEEAGLTRGCAADRCSEKCYSCHSGGQGFWQSPDCLPNGNMTDLARENFVMCQAPCVTKVNRWPLGDVTRGCSSMFYLAQDAPATGCVTLEDGSTMCYCSGPWCNDDDRTGERDKIIDKYE